MTIFQLLNGATFAALLFVVASGFTLIFGLMRIVNLAHGALYLFGGYLGLTVANFTGNFFLGAIGAAVGVALTGFIIDFGLLRFVRGVELRQVLLTLGVAITYPTYRLFVLLVGIVIFISLSLLITKTRLGALIRAGVDDAETVSAMGVDIRRVFIYTFMLGSALAGLGGVMGGAFLTLYPTADSEILVYSLAVVIIGGRGSLIGAAVGSLLVGMLSTFGQVWFPELAYFVIFGPMAILLAFRPLGLFGKVA